MSQKVSLARRFALVPLGPPLLAYSSNCKAMLTPVDDAVELVVDRTYKAGESIVVWYNVCFIGHNFNLFLLSLSSKEDLPPSDPVCIFQYKSLYFFCRCGPQPNSKLLINYGFIDEDNPYDRLVVEVKSLLFVLSCMQFVLL